MTGFRNANSSWLDSLCIPSAPVTPDGKYNFVYKSIQFVMSFLVKCSYPSASQKQANFFVIMELPGSVTFSAQEFNETPRGFSWKENF